MIVVLVYFIPVNLNVLFLVEVLKSYLWKADFHPEMIQVPMKWRDYGKQ